MNETITHNEGPDMQTTATKTEACAKCEYWNEVNSGEGECRRQPPQAITFKVNEEVKYETRFPTTKGQDWCGEFSAR